MHWGRETVGSTLYGISVSNIAKVNSNNNNNKKKPYFSLPSPCFHLKTTTIIKIAQERERAHVCIFGVWPYIFIVVPQRPHINRVIRPWCFSEIVFVYVSIAVMIVLLFTLLHFLLLFVFFFFPCERGSSSSLFKHIHYFTRTDGSFYMMPFKVIR